MEIIVNKCEKYRNERERACTPAVTDVADVAESLQVLQIEPSSTDLWQELKALRDELKSLVGRVGALEDAVIPEDTFSHCYWLLHWLVLQGYSSQRST